MADPTPTSIVAAFIQSQFPAPVVRNKPLTP